MKAKRHLFELFLVLAITGILIWKFWPAKDSASAPVAVATTPVVSKTAAPPAIATTTQVEAPKFPPANVTPTTDNLSVPGNGSTLYDASKARAALTGTAQNGDEDYNAIVNGSTGLAKLQNTIAQNAALTQALPPIDQSSTPPLNVTDLGEITLTSKTVRRVLNTGIEVTFLLQGPSDERGIYYVQVQMALPDDHGVSVSQSINTPIQPGQPAVIKFPSTGYEIRFVPVLANPAGTSP